MTLATVIILAVPLLFIVSLYLGNKEEPPKLEEEVGNLEKQIEKEIEGEVKAEELPTYESPEQAEPSEPIALPSEDDKADASEIARQFIYEFHAVDENDPLAYLRESKEFMTDRLYAEYEGIPKRGTLAAVKAEAVDLETTPAELEDDRQVWAVYVTSEETAADGTVNRVFNGYSVLLKKDGDRWLVDGVRADDY